ncbi:MAG: Hsp70 family protein [Nitriliruptoraceae bacterium]
MTYNLGVDVGTTYTAAAVSSNGRAEIVTLGNRSAVIPTVVYLREPDALLVGDAANRRAFTDPAAVAREFKRRVGDPTPILLAGSPMSPQALMARTLRWVVDQVTAQQGTAPASITATHPANWGPYKLDLFHQAMRLADLGAARMLAEPVAAAAHYASHARIEDGAAVAVYDLGGGTFDAAVVRRVGPGFELLGVPEGIEHLGGIDVDEAVFAAVSGQLGAAFSSLDPDDANVVAAVARLRQECVDAKEALSSERTVAIPVLLPGTQTQIELRRDELEQMVRPALDDTLGALRRAIASAGLSAGDLTAVLLVGGSSRIPLVAQMVTEALGRPVAVDSHPKHSVALGAARTGPAVRTQAAVPAPPPGAVPAASSTAALDTGSASADPDHTMVVDTGRTPVAGEPTGVLSPSAAAGPWDAVRDEPTEPALASIGGGDRARPAPRGRGRWIAAGLVALLAIGALAVANLSDSGTDEPGFAVDPVDDPTDDPADEAEEEPVDGAEPVVDPVEEASADGSGEESEEPSEEPEEAEEPAVPEEPVAPTVPPAACDGGSCITIDDIALDSGELLITWTADGFVPDTSATHAHFYWGIYDAAQVGTNAADRSPWELTDAQPFVPGGELQLANRPAGADTVCVTAADGEHAVIEPANHHCVPLPADA